MPFRHDETNPELFVLYTGTNNPTIAEYQAFYNHWAKRLKAGETFGTVIVYEPREYSGEDERDAAWEDAYSRLITEFRNTSRDANSAQSLGFARVLLSGGAKAFFENPERLERMNSRIDRYARYMYGVPGRVYPDLGAAAAWFKTRQAGSGTTVRHDLKSSRRAEVGLYYGSTTGMTEFVAEKIATAWDDAEPLEPVNISYLPDMARLTQHPHIILGISTWNIGQLQDDWRIHWDDLKMRDFSGVTVAIFGVGDQVNYAENFLDAVGELAQRLRERGATLVGFWPTEGYEFSASTAQKGEVFCGLGIDEVNQEELTDDRIETWLEQVRREFAASEAMGATV